MVLGMTTVLVVWWVASILAAIVAGRWVRQVELLLWPTVLLGPVGMLLGSLLVRWKLADRAHQQQQSEV